MGVTKLAGVSSHGGNAMAGVSSGCGGRIIGGDHSRDSSRGDVAADNRGKTATSAGSGTDGVAKLPR